MAGDLQGVAPARCEGMGANEGSKLPRAIGRKEEKGAPLADTGHAQSRTYWPKGHQGPTLEAGRKI